MSAQPSCSWPLGVPCVTVAMLPSLSPLLGVAIPVVAAAAAVGGGVLGFGKEKIAEQVEKRQAERSMLGILATVRPN